MNQHFLDIRSDQAEGKTEEENDDDCMVLEQEGEEEGGNKQPSPAKPDQKADTEKNKPEELLHQASTVFFSLSVFKSICNIIYSDFTVVLPCKVRSGPRYPGVDSPCGSGIVRAFEKFRSIGSNF